MKSAALVYQGGIANVFDTTRGNFPDLWPHIILTDTKNCRRRLLQGDFRSCEMFTLGLVAAGVKVNSYACNMAGDIIAQNWSQDLDSAPFSEKMNPVRS